MAERISRGRWILGLAVATTVVLGVAVTSAWNGPRPRSATQASQPEGPPTDPNYQAALRRGRAGKLAAPRKDLIALAAAAPDTNIGAWAVYQAALAARAGGDDAGHRKLLERLGREYPGHSLALRMATQPAFRRSAFRHSGERKTSSTDCGPRALAWMLRRAGKPADLARLTRQCKTGKTGTTLLALRDAARKHGLRAEGAQVNADFLRRERPRGLAWVNGAHYVCFEPTADHRVSVWDPNRKTPADEDWERLVERSQGVVLLVAWGGTPLPEL